MEYTLVDWNTRGFNYKVKLLNADKFPHMYVNVDFGGTRGWENQFQYTDPTTVIDEETGEEVLPFDRGGTDEHLVANPRDPDRSEEHPSELQSLMRISYAVLCLQTKTKI